MTNLMLLAIGASNHIMKINAYLRSDKTHQNNGRFLDSKL